MKNFKCTLFANVGQGGCLLYIIHCAYLSVIMTGYKVNGSIGTSDLYRWEDLSWKWSEVNWMIVAIMTIVAITIVLPWLKYWQDLEIEGSSDFGCWMSQCMGKDRQFLLFFIECGLVLELLAAIE